MGTSAAGGTVGWVWPVAQFDPASLCPPLLCASLVLGGEVGGGGCHG